MTDITRTVDQSKVIEDAIKYESKDKITSVKLNGEQIKIKWLNNTGGENYKHINIFQVVQNSIFDAFESEELLTEQDVAKLKRVESNIRSEWNDKHNGFNVRHEQTDSQEYLYVEIEDLGRFKVDTIRKNQTNIVNERYDDYQSVKNYVMKRKFYNENGVKVVKNNNIISSFKHAVDYSSYKKSFIKDMYYSLFILFTIPVQIPLMILSELFGYKSSNIPFYTFLIASIIPTIITYYNNDKIAVDNSENARETVERVKTRVNSS